jgi:hypothetical protein
MRPSDGATFPKVVEATAHAAIAQGNDGIDVAEASVRPGKLEPGADRHLPPALASAAYSIGGAG